MPKRTRIRALVLSVASAAAVVLAAAAPAQAAVPPAQGAGGCTDGGTITVCIGENPEPALVASATMDHVYQWSTCSVSVTIYEPGTGANRVTSPVVDCTTATPFVSEHAVVGHTYVACVQGTVNSAAFTECTPFQLAHP